MLITTTQINDVHQFVNCNNKFYTGITQKLDIACVVSLYCVANNAERRSEFFRYSYGFGFLQYPKIGRDIP
jgi:hypothetical protein